MRSRAVRHRRRHRVPVRHVFMGDWYSGGSRNREHDIADPVGGQRIDSVGGSDQRAHDQLGERDRGRARQSTQRSRRPRGGWNDCLPFGSGQRLCACHDKHGRAGDLFIWRDDADLRRRWLLECGHRGLLRCCAAAGHDGTVGSFEPERRWGFPEPDQPHLDPVDRRCWSCRLPGLPEWRTDWDQRSQWICRPFPQRPDELHVCRVGFRRRRQCLRTDGSRDGGNHFRRSDGPERAGESSELECDVDVADSDVEQLD